jgi:hypothetical protein
MAVLCLQAWPRRRHISPDRPAVRRASTQVRFQPILRAMGLWTKLRQKPAPPPSSRRGAVASAPAPMPTRPSATVASPTRSATHANPRGSGGTSSSSGLPRSSYPLREDERGNVQTRRPTGEVIAYGRRRTHVALEGIQRAIPNSEVTLASEDRPEVEDSDERGFGWRRIRGEDYRLDNVRAAFKAAELYPPTQQRFAVATLEVDPTNAADPNAVKVVIADRHVGFIPRDETAPYRRIIADLAQCGLDATCRAWIYRSEQDTTRIRIRLALARPLRRTI